METRVPRPSRIEDMRVVPMEEDGKHHRGKESQRNQDAAKSHNVSFTWVFPFLRCHEFVQSPAAIARNPERCMNSARKLQSAKCHANADFRLSNSPRKT